MSLMGGEAINYIGNACEQDQLASLSLTGLSRVVELFYVSSPVGLFLGNLTAAEQMKLSLGTGSRVVELVYVSALGN